MLKNLPKKIKLILLIFKGLNLKDSLKIIQQTLYLWQEFYILTSIEPVVKEYIVSFTYKDNVLLNFKTDKTSDIIKIMEDIKKSRG